MLQQHVAAAPGSSTSLNPPTAAPTPHSGKSPSVMQIRAMPGTLRSGGSSSGDSTPSARTRKTRSLKETIAKKVGTFLEAHVDRQKEEEVKHLSEPVLRPLLTAAILKREPLTTHDDNLGSESGESPMDNLTHLIKNAITCPIHKESLLSLRKEAAADTLLLMQEMLDDPVAFGVEARRHTVRRLLIRLSREAKILPASLFLSGVICRVRESVNGGAFADIYRGSFGGKPVALKRLRVFRIVVDKESRELNAAFFREALVWRQLRHPHILPFLGIDRSSFRPFLCMVSPYMENGNVIRCMEHLESNGAHIPRELWLLEIARGLEYLHQEQVVHGDLRGANILIDGDLHVRLSDFGLSMLVDSNPLSTSPSEHGGVGRWSAPELFHGSRQSVKSDVWSFACVCIEIYTRSQPYAHLNNVQVIPHILKGHLPTMPPSDSGIQLYMLNLLEHCFAKSPSSRPDASSLVRILLRCTPLVKKVKAIRLSQKPLPAPPVDLDAENFPDPDSPAQTSSPETTTATQSLHFSPPLDVPRETSQYLTLPPPMSPISLHSFVMVTSSSSSPHSQESHVPLPSSPSSGSHESHFASVSSPSAGSHSSHFLPSGSPPSSGRRHQTSEVSSGYVILSDSPRNP
ncbi:kinase-like domain-containing protein [Cristinia sonorae]|uniref:Kinase-like domain-containing protein n=1 Tax=Cristinia sonorae TaxID=1940300 RepID=A0A8K0UGM8_9AGAR|nr:kinase-like domain-containing protein [Cristinia sonorae]